MVTDEVDVARAQGMLLSYMYVHMHKSMKVSERSTRVYVIEMGILFSEKQGNLYSDISSKIQLYTLV